uniref:Uncharacterized protein n=1 Tax=Anguilla anguilla TaxID=7936 RepID=A0A0E9TKT4_ANGAN
MKARRSKVCNENATAPFTTQSSATPVLSPR